MAKAILCLDAIRLIISTRDNPRSTHTFNEISKIVEEVFKVSVSPQGIGKAYRKYRNDPRFISDSQNFLNNEKANSIEFLTSKEHKKIDSKITDNILKGIKKFDENIVAHLSKQDIDDFLS